VPNKNSPRWSDLSDIDFDKLAALFQQKPRTANEQLRATVVCRL
jgi:cytochrome c553